MEPFASRISPTRSVTTLSTGQIASSAPDLDEAVRLGAMPSHTAVNAPPHAAELEYCLATGYRR